MLSRRIGFRLVVCGRLGDFKDGIGGALVRKKDIYMSGKRLCQGPVLRHVHEVFHTALVDWKPFYRVDFAGISIKGRGGGGRRSCSRSGSTYAGLHRRWFGVSFAPQSGSNMISIKFQIK
jgi:hypothetical protein